MFKEGMGQERKYIKKKFKAWNEVSKEIILSSNRVNSGKFMHGWTLKAKEVFKKHKKGL